ncbi:MAG TPA: GumC family protein, partial [Roseateles sp.]|uniref:GumC family protein n=1 Tax=Roseateles sp. TaxID=1971397 RepID=UPI002ED78AEF
MNRELSVIQGGPPAPMHPHAAIPANYAHPGISLTQLLTIVWAYRKITLAIVASAVVLAAIVTKLMPKTYEATATLMVDYDVNDPLGGREFPIGLMSNYMSTQIQLIRSPAVLLPAIQQLGLDKQREYVSGYRPEGGASLGDFVAANVGRKLTVEQGEWSSQLINIVYAADNPKEAARVANGIGDVYAQQQYRRLTGPVAERDARYKQQLEDLKARVDKAEAELAAYRQKNGLVEGQDSDADIEMERLTSLEHRLLEAQEQRRVTELSNTGNLTSRNAVIGSESISGLKSQLAELRGQLAQLSSTLGPRHPQVVELNAQVDSTQRALNAEMSVYSNNAEAQIGAARSLEGQLRGAVAQERTRVLSKRKRQAEGAKLVLELETAKALYKQALDGYDQVMLATSGKYNNVHYISRATPPVKAESPKPLVNLLAALM